MPAPKFLANFICAFIPSRKLRTRIRKTLLSACLVAVDFAPIADFITRNLQAMVKNQKAFGEYKNAFAGRDVVIVAAGPTANDYVPIEGAIHIGGNRAFLLDKIKFNFLFAGDLLGIDSFLDGFAKYDCIKFIGDHPAGAASTISESYCLKMKNVRKYNTDAGILSVSGSRNGGWAGEDVIPLDIDIRPLHSSGTVAHHAFQFALFTNPRKIYLVGCDCNVATAGHFVQGQNDAATRDNNKEYFESGAADAKLIDGWIKLKQFAEIYYPDTEIISINPVGLKGIFADVCTNKNKEK